MRKLLKRAFQIAVQHQRGIGAQVVEHGRRVVKEQRQVVLDASGGDAVAHVLVDAALGGVALQQLAPAVAKLGARRLVHGEFAAGQQAHFGHRVQAALAVGVEGADRVDLVVEQIHPVGQGAAHGEQVDQPAAHRVLARADHLRDVRVAGQRELAFQRRFVQLLPLLEVKRVARHEAGRRQPVQRRGGGDQHHVRLLLANCPQRGQPLADQVLVRAEGVVGQRLPVGKHHAAQAGREEAHLVHQAPRVARVGGDDGGELFLAGFAFGQLRQQKRVA